MKNYLYEIKFIIKSTNNQKRLKLIKQKYPKYYKEILKLKSTGKFISISEALYAYIHKLKKRPICIVCGGKVNFKSQSVGFSKFCSRECNGKIPPTLFNRERF